MKNREIKFRAWDGINKKMIYPTVGQSFGMGSDAITNGQIIDKYDKVMQFTGLKDKHGKEIYEGDILEYENKGMFPPIERYNVVYSTIHVSDYEDYIAAFMLEDKHNGRQLICNITRPYKYAKIIGNIHETPRLLNHC